MEYKIHIRKMNFEKTVVLYFWFSLVSVIFGARQIDTDYYFGLSHYARTGELMSLENEADNIPPVQVDDRDESSPTSSGKHIIFYQVPLKKFTNNIPILRHHIAHFCPNLELARQCIRKCMKKGQPAFCGKDHVCYCGHKYRSHDKNEKINPEVVKTQFHDLYTKYFGPNLGSNLHKLLIASNSDESVE